MATEWRLAILLPDDDRWKLLMRLEPAIGLEPMTWLITNTRDRPVFPQEISIVATGGRPWRAMA